MLKRSISQRFSTGKRYSEDYLLWLEIAFSGIEAHKSDMALAFSYKAEYGQGGLSAQLWRMEQGELDTYLQLRKKKYISRSFFILLCTWSLIKFGKRALIMNLRK
jgi:hypothetical protein